MALHNQGADSQFTVFIRLPFPRGDFVDPPPVEWNAAKDHALWDILSRPSKGDGIDWKALADDFEVTLQFLLQQAAWLYDRQLSQVRAQMRKVGTTPSNSPSPAPPSVSGSAALGGPPARGGPSTAPRAPSRLSSHREAYPQRTAGSRRASSSTTVNQTRGSRAASRTETPTAETKEPRWEAYGRRPSMTRREQPPAPAPHKSPTLEEEEDAISSSSEESDAEEDTADRKTPRFKRFGRFSTQRPGLRDDEDDEDDSPAFLPLSRESEQPREGSRQDLNATLRLDQQPGGPRRRQSEQQPEPKKSATESSASSASSGVPVSVAESEEQRRKSKLPAGLSPRRAAEIAGVSPRRSTASGKSASDDTPSMGSSFSDLDDASVSQSALEEALMSNMQHGGMASRMSTISQALRSRYLQ